MARIRTVKPEYFSHPEVTECSIPARLLFLSLLTQADDDGRLLDQPRKIAGLAWGEVDDADTEALLTELHKRQRILRYEVGGKRIIQVVHFSEHQAISASKYRPSSLPSAGRQTVGSHVAAERQPPGNHVSAGRQAYDSEKAIQEVEVEVEVEQGSGTGNREQDQIPHDERADVENPKPTNPFALDEHQLGIIGMLLDRYPQWVDPPGALTYGGVTKLQQKYGPRALTEALEDLLDEADGVSKPHPWLAKAAESHSSGVRG